MCNSFSPFLLLSSFFPPSSSWKNFRLVFRWLNLGRSENSLTGCGRRRRRLRNPAERKRKLLSTSQCTDSRYWLYVVLRTVASFSNYLCLSFRFGRPLSPTAVAVALESESWTHWILQTNFQMIWWGKRQKMVDGGVGCISSACLFAWGSNPKVSWT